jgi:diguanylate cyclase (GGDEF)-like protein
MNAGAAERGLLDTKRQIGHTGTMPSTTAQHESPSPPAPAGRPDEPGSAGCANEARIVVVDDEPLNMEGLAEFLRGAGYSCPASLTGSEATAQRLRDEQPDLVLLELALDQADPFEVLRAMHADRLLRHVPAVVLTAQDDRTSRLRALELGAVDFLVKPVDGGELELRLRNTLTAKAYRDQLAHTDHLTGLPNSESMLWRLDWALKHALRHGTVGAVLQLGLERFRQIIDALGPAVGDELLHAVSQRLVAGLRDSDTVVRGPTPRAGAMVARSRGEEFTLLLPFVERAEAAAAVARRMIGRMAAPFVLAGHEVFVSCRVGIAVFPGVSADKDTVLQHAGVALHTANEAAHAGSAGYQFYSQQLNAQSLHRLNVERELRLALERNDLRLHYQAQVDTASGVLRGAEALVRWQHPSRGLLGPFEFIGVAEETGLIVKVGEWVLRESLRQLAEWRRAGLALAHVAVNVSGLQLQRAGLADVVRDALRISGVDAGSLCLELTETAIIESGPQVTDTLAGIKQLGVRLALDDFGTGYSSLTYLRRFPIDELKIDRSFVTDCDRDANNSAITGAIIAMAHRLGLRVVAEGVETPQQLAFIRANGADMYQGYLFAKPLPAEEFSRLMAGRRRAIADAEIAAAA